jgi:hypothetical protein
MGRIKTNATVPGNTVIAAAVEYSSSHKSKLGILGALPVGKSSGNSGFVLKVGYRDGVRRRDNSA